MNAPVAKKEKTVIETVTMDDGRIVDFAGKRKMLKASSVSPEGVVAVRLDFRNGETRLFTVPAKLTDKFVAHGAEQKLGDEIAGLEDVADCVEAVDVLMTRLEAGEWGVARESSGMSGQSVLVRALVQLTGKTVENVREFLSKKTQAEKMTLRNSDKVKPLVEKLEAEKASKAPKVDTDALLAELGEATI